VADWELERYLTAIGISESVLLAHCITLRLSGELNDIASTDSCSLLHFTASGIEIAFPLFSLKASIGSFLGRLIPGQYGCFLITK
jgi:hypothetical protein